MRWKLQSEYQAFEFQLIQIKYTCTTQFSLTSHWNIHVLDSHAWPFLWKMREKMFTKSYSYRTPWRGSGRWPWTDTPSSHQPPTPAPPSEAGLKVDIITPIKHSSQTELAVYFIWFCESTAPDARLKFKTNLFCEIVLYVHNLLWVV